MLTLIIWFLMIVGVMTIGGMISDEIERRLNDEVCGSVYRERKNSD